MPALRTWRSKSFDPVALGRWGTALVVAILMLLPRPAEAHAGPVAVLVVPAFSPRTYAERGAVGLMVPGAGPTVSRRGALAALVRGRVENALLGGVPSGRPSFAPARRPGAVTIYVSLPPPGRHRNDRRYPVAIVGGGYRGLLTSSGTRVPGLVSVADVAPTVRALERRTEPPIGSRASRDAPSELRTLEGRLRDAQAGRGAASAAVAALAGLLGVVALTRRSATAARAGVLVPPLAVLAALVLSWLQVGSPLIAVISMSAIAGVGAALVAVTARSSRLFGAALVSVFALLLPLLALRPQWSSLAVLGPHPDRGGRFYGLTNQVETMLLVPLLLGGRLLGARWLLPAGALALVTVGWSRAGADGGGTIVVAVGLVVLALRLLRPQQRRLRRWALALAALAAPAALIGLDLATGGSSHVTDAVRGGPRALLHDFGHRLDVSVRSATTSVSGVLLLLVCLAVLAWLATRTPRAPALDALVVALAVSLLVNDTPVDVAAWGTLAAESLWILDRMAPAARRPPGAEAYRRDGRLQGTRTGTRAPRPLA